ncbi:MAG: GNAT family N-acetyltransferase [Trueperaceae bacterium]
MHLRIKSLQTKPSLTRPLQTKSSLTDGEIWLEFITHVPGDAKKTWLPADHYQIQNAKREAVGKIDLRLGYTPKTENYYGHIGYSVDEKFRGHHYAAKACLLLKPVALQHGMGVLWITCNPDNWPSRKTCESIGATFVEIVDVPKDDPLYWRGEIQKCRYRWVIY